MKICAVLTGMRAVDRKIILPAPASYARYVDILNEGMALPAGVDGGELDVHGANGLALRQRGPCSVYALAKTVERNYSNVHTDIGRLEQHGLVHCTPEDAVFVPFESSCRICASRMLTILSKTTHHIE